MRAVITIIGLLIAVGLPEIPVNGFVASRTTMAGHLEREAFFWIVTAILIAYILLVEKRGTSAMAGLMHTPLWFRFILVLRAAVFEEIAYRGYSIERTQELTGSRIFAFLFSVAAFTYAHAGYWGWASLLIPAFGGIVLAGLYLWRRDLSCNMIAHFIADGAGFLFSG